MTTSLARYTDRRVLITGGGSGIGQATVLRILAEGGQREARSTAHRPWRTVGSPVPWRRLHDMELAGTAG